MTSRERSVVGDPVRLRALAHPIRLDLLERLSTDGPLTATQAGERIGQSSGSASFHLRQLERYGFVEPVPGVTGRQKPWQLALRGLSWFHEDGTLAADTEEEADDLARTGAAVSTMLLQRAVDDAATWLEGAADRRGHVGEGGRGLLAGPHDAAGAAPRARRRGGGRCSPATTTRPTPTSPMPAGCGSRS